MKLLSILLFAMCLALGAGEGVSIRIEDSKGKTDSRHLRLIALYNKKGSPVTPFVEAGKYKAVFSGVLNLKERSRVYFKFSGSGKAVLKLGGEVVVEASGEDLSDKVSERLRLNPGEHEFTVEYESNEDGSGQVRLLWMGRSFPWEPIGPEYLKYKESAELTKGAELRSGRELVAKFNCIKCHSAGELDAAAAMPEALKDAPNLDNAGNRFSESWMAAWIQNPKALRPQATMPSLLAHASLGDAAKAGDSSAADLAAYLKTRKTQEYPMKKLPGAFAKEGGDLFHKLGCISCHTRPDKPGNADRLPLHNIGWKFPQASALADFLANPAKHYKWIKMPDFGLKPDEALKLAVYLKNSSKSNGEKTAKGDAAKGKELYTKLGCVSCHEPKAEPLSKALADIKSFDAGCISGSKVNFNFDDKQKAAVKSFLSKEVSSLKNRSLAEFAERQIREVNCNACHQYDSAVSQMAKYHHETEDLNAHEGGHLDQSRPILTWFGEKLQTAYLKKILAGELDHRPRPWLDARMPAFKERSALLAEGMAAAHGLSPEKEVKPANKEVEAAGKKLIGTQGGFSCIICHDAGPKKALAAFEVKGIDLQYAEERLRPEYYLRWMLDPQRIIPLTKMPKFATDGLTALPDFDGEAKKQFEAMWEFMKHGRKIPEVK